MLGTWRPTKNKSEHLVNEALSLMRKFNHCEFSLNPRGQVGYATKLATDLVGTKKREACKRERPAPSAWKTPMSLRRRLFCQILPVICLQCKPIPLRAFGETTL